jgi:hypothetical protein
VKTITNASAGEGCTFDFAYGVDDSIRLNDICRFSGAEVREIIVSAVEKCGGLLQAVDAYLILP